MTLIAVWHNVKVVQRAIALAIANGLAKTGGNSKPLAV